MKRIICPNCKEELEAVYEYVEAMNRHDRKMDEFGELYTYDTESGIEFEDIPKLLMVMCPQCDHTEQNYDRFIIEGE